MKFAPPAPALPFRYAPLQRRGRGKTPKQFTQSALHSRENFLTRLKNELDDNILVLFVLSKNFYESTMCLCEMGATWIKTNKHIPILIPPFDYAQIKGVINNIQGIKINEPLEINLLKKEIEGAFNLKSLEFSIWESKRDKKITSIQSKIQVS